MKSEDYFVEGFEMSSNHFKRNCKNIMSVMMPCHLHWLVHVIAENGCNNFLL